MNRTVVWTAALTGLAVLAPSGIAALVFIYSGEYNVAASEPHSAIERWALDTTMENSVRDHAAGIKAPPLDQPSLTRSGFHHFQEMCVTCHGAPGQERSEIGNGLTATPPELSEAVSDWTEAELYWIVKHGIKMSGMPAFGRTHSDKEIWGIVAFLRRLPALSPEEYQTLQQAQGGGDSGTGQGHGGGQGHSH